MKEKMQNIIVSVHQRNLVDNNEEVDQIGEELSDSEMEDLVGGAGVVISVGLSLDDLERESYVGVGIIG